MIENIERNEAFNKTLDEALKNIAPKKEGAEPSAPQETSPQEEPAPQPGQTEPQGEPTPQENEPTPEPSPTPEPAEFDISNINERFQTQFENEDALRSSLNRLNDLENYDQAVSERDNLQTEVDQWKQKYEEVASTLDPRKHFVSEEEYKRQLILQKHGEDVNPALLNEIISRDLTQMTDVDVLTLYKLVENPNIIGGQQGAKDLVYRQLGIDPETPVDEWDNTSKNLILEAANSARKKLNGIKSIEVPEAVDYAAQQAQKTQESQQRTEQLTQDWNTVTGKMMEGFNEMSFTREVDGKNETYFTYAVSPEFRATAQQLATNYLVDNGIEPNEEGIKQAQSYVEDLFWNQKGIEIMQAYGKDVASKLTESTQQQQDNPAPQNTQEAPEGSEDAGQKELESYVKEGLGNSRKPGEMLDF
jgi:hypothetical protein